MIRPALALALWLAFCAPALAQAPAAPAAVMAKVQQLDQACRLAGGRPAGRTYIFVYDFTGDGVNDYLVSEGDYGCAGREGVLRQTGGTAFIEIWVADGRGGATRAYRELLLGYRILDRRPRAVQVAQRGPACGAAAQCGSTLVWNGRTQRFDSQPVGSAAVAAAPPAAPPTGPAAAPAPPAGPVVAENRAAFMARCVRERTAKYGRDAGNSQSICGDAWTQVEAARPMAEAILALAPAARGPVDLVGVQGRLGGVRWGRPISGSAAAGALGPLAVSVTGRAPVQRVDFSWAANGEPIPFALPDALTGRGVRLDLVACMAFGASEQTQVYRATPLGKPPFALTIAFREAPTANASSSFGATVDLTGQVPTLASLNRPNNEWTATCPE